ncbi:hypothetical protein HPB48_017485 [Haemaphysalis longicornis]|uniref:Uncharacterized protein n=1 Tax=Haemaphysalis longicornis TaxID=44386 RepID=A0A9J6FSW6_HAELO|nr:hypothetical protein HPB48_017485 [Haemaphysalis longicornis]
MLSWMITRKRELDLQEQAMRRDQEANALEYEMKRRALQRDLQDRRRLAATRGTVLCIVCCGLALAFLGAALTALGALLRAGAPLKAPCIVAGPTCIVMGFLVLLLSVETVIKCRRAQRFQQSDSKETLLERALHKAAGGAAAARPRTPTSTTPPRPARRRREGRRAITQGPPPLPTLFFWTRRDSWNPCRSKRARRLRNRVRCGLRKGSTVLLFCAFVVCEGSRPLCGWCMCVCFCVNLPAVEMVRHEDMTWNKVECAVTRR